MPTWSKPSQGGQPAEEVDRLRRLIGDQALLDDLQRENFDGPLWDRVADALAEYGFSVMCAWILSGEIIQRCQEKGIPCSAGGRPDGRAMEKQDAEEIAADIVAIALNAFRDKVLRRGRWSPSGGASLSTFFVGQCLMQYSNVFRRWKREAQAAHTVSLKDAEEELDESIDVPDIRLASNPEHRIIVSDELYQVLDQLEPRVRQALLFRALGYSNAEIAELLEVSPSTVERIFSQHRRTFQKGPDNSSPDQQSLRRQPPAPDGGRTSE
jgi:RNA polymerase sigma factor (sigma-70 family)